MQETEVWKKSDGDLDIHIIRIISSGGKIDAVVPIKYFGDGAMQYIIAALIIITWEKK